MQHLQKNRGTLLQAKCPSLYFRFPPIPILELMPFRAFTFLFKELQEPILQPICFQIHAGMGGTTHLLNLWKSARLSRGEGE